MKVGERANWNMTHGELTEFMQVRGAVISTEVCQKGSYYGVEPTKLRNGQLRWPNDSRERLREAGWQMLADRGAAKVLGRLPAPVKLVLLEVLAANEPAQAKAPTKPRIRTRAQG